MKSFIMRKAILILWGALLSLFGAHLCAQGAQVADDLPHIIFILADDMGYNDVGWAGDDYVGLTPTLDSLRNNAIELTEYYTQQLCTPARAALLSGRYPFKIGMQEAAITTKSDWGLPIEYELLPQYLSAYGYESHGVGKWHLGHAYEHYTPHQRGFTSFYGFLGAMEHYRSHLTYAENSYLDLMESWSTSDSNYVDQNGNPAKQGWACVKNKGGVYSSELFTNRAINIANQWAENGGKDSNTPLFFYMAYQNPHKPSEPDDTMDYSKVQHILDKITNMKRLDNAKLVYNLDYEVKRLLLGLERAGIMENYILIFASDNGPCFMDGGSSYPLRGGKMYTYEGGAKTRAFIKSPLLPNSAGKSASYTGMFHVTDWLPTLMDAVSIEWSKTDVGLELDGLSHWSTLLSGSSESFPRSEIIYNLQETWDDERGEPMLYGALRVENWKLVLNEDCMLWADFEGRYDDDIYTSECLHEYQCTAYTDTRSYLFNLDDDPYEINDLKGKYKMQYHRLRSKMIDHAKLMRDPISDIGTTDQSTFDSAYEKVGCIHPWLLV